MRDLQAQLDEATGSAARAAKKEAASLRQRVSGVMAHMHTHMGGGHQTLRHVLTCFLYALHV